MGYFEIISELTRMSESNRQELASEIMEEVDNTGETQRETELEWLLQRGYFE